jgi:hypothetical protein
MLLNIKYSIFYIILYYIISYHIILLYYIILNILKKIAIFRLVWHLKKRPQEPTKYVGKLYRKNAIGSRLVGGFFWGGKPPGNHKLHYIISIKFYDIYVYIYMY